MKKINKKQNYKAFIDNIFERAQNPVEELKKIFTIHPIFFLNDDVVEYVNSKLDKLGLALNTDYISECKNIVFSCSYGQTSSGPSHGPCNSGGGAWSDCSHANDFSLTEESNSKYNNLILVKKDKKISYGIIN